MKIEHIRIANVHKPCSDRAYCISHVYINGKYSHDVIEHYDRGLDESMSVDDIKAIKSYSKTAIPSGIYSVRMDMLNNKLKRKEYYFEFCRGYVPCLQNVKGYDQVAICCGIDENSSDGSLIVGENKVKGKVTNSKMIFERLYAEMKKAYKKKENITYTISRMYTV